MVSRRFEVHIEEDQQDCPRIDEGWWASILADEDAFLPSVKEAIRPPEPATAESVDWQRALDLFEQDEIVALMVHGYNRGGLLVRGDGIQGFVPISHLVDMPTAATEEERKQILAAYQGRCLPLKVIECEPSQERIVLSERAAQAGEGTRKQLFECLQVGKVVRGTVTNVTDFGAFVDLGGVEGLIHVSELSWGRVQHPSDFVEVGQSVQVLVLQVNEENSRIALSLKRLNPNPWDELPRLYKPGDVTSGTITAIMRFGAFARLPEGVEGLIHISSITLPVRDGDLRSVFFEGQDVQVKILHIDSERRRLGLGLIHPE